MNRESFIFFAGIGLDKPELSTGAEAFPLPIKIGAKSETYWIGFRWGAVGLSEVVGVARRLADVTIDRVLKELSDRGGAVACHKGCHAACCRHLLVSLSVPEALAMMDEVNALDSRMQTGTIQSCQRVARKIRERLAANPALATGFQGRDGILDWYMGLDQECPFLKDQFCSIYDRRPITCRECLVTNPVSHCRKGIGQIVQKVKLPVRFATILTQFSKELYGTEDELVVLPCVFDWFLENRRRYEKTWPAEYLVRRFIEIAMAKSSAIPFVISDLSGKLPGSMETADNRDFKTMR